VGSKGGHGVWSRQRVDPSTHDDYTWQPGSCRALKRTVAILEDRKYSPNDAIVSAEMDLMAQVSSLEVTSGGWLIL